MRAKCKVSVCERPAEMRGWCKAHYVYWRKMGKIPTHPIRPPANTQPVCRVEGCGRATHRQNYCMMHYTRVSRGKPVGPADPLRRATGTGSINANGYHIRQAGGRGGRVHQVHRLIMEQKLGRPLLATETVHHKNGDRADNRPENLELRVGQHGPGQRLEDRIADALALLRRYAPETLR